MKPSQRKIYDFIEKQYISDIAKSKDSPNLVCEKISAFWKEKGAEVELKLDYDDLDKYDEVFISKVFTDTWVLEWIAAGIDMDKVEVNLPNNIHVGGTGFFFAHAPNLLDEIEHGLWDMKVSKHDINAEYTLQLLAYYLMGLKSDPDTFENISKLVFFNPRKNICYWTDVSFIPQSVMSIVSREVIGYIDT